MTDPPPDMPPPDMSGGQSPGHGPETPDEGIAQDPGIPGWDAMSDRSDSPPPDEKDESAELRERLDEPDREGHMTAPSGDSEDETRDA